MGQFVEPALSLRQPCLRGYSDRTTWDFFSSAAQPPTAGSTSLATLLSTSAAQMSGAVRQVCVSEYICS